MENQIQDLITESNSIIKRLHESPDEQDYQDLEYNTYMLNDALADEWRNIGNVEFKVTEDDNLYLAKRAELFPDFRKKEGVKSDVVANAMLDVHFATTIKDRQEEKEKLRVRKADYTMWSTKCDGINRQCRFWNSFFFRESSGMKRTV